MSAAKKIIVLKNSGGTVVRTLQGFEREGFLVRLTDTGRVEAHQSLEGLKDRDISFEVLGSFSLAQIQKNPLKIQDVGTLELLEKVEGHSRGPDFQQDNEEEFKSILKWTGGVHLILVALLLVLASTISYFTQEEELVVEVFSQEIELKREAPPTVSVSERKPQPTTQRVQPKQSPTKQRVAEKSRPVPTKSRVSQNRTQRAQSPAAQPKQPKSVGQMGALGALGGPSSSNRSGLDIGQAGAKGVAGLGEGSRSGVGRAIHSAGAIAVSSGGGQGAGSGARGGGGYSTRGKGSGQAEYGKHSLGGASSGFINPLSAESQIEGGLDRAAVDAVVRRNQGQIAYCYEKGLQVSPRIAGRVNLQWNIAPTGRVSSIGVVSSSLRDQEVVNCMMSKVRSWQFPKPVGGVNVKVSQYPFDLRKNM